jgi:restriction endonuclease S subunit
MLLAALKITPADLVLYGGLLLTILNIIDRSTILKEKTEKPRKEMEERVDSLDNRIAEIENKLKNYDYRVIQLEDGVKVLLRSMSALLSHSIDGNNLEEMKDARDDLNEYLISK